MAKRFCAYCSAPADTRDHVPPKSFLERPYPDNLKTVSSCQKCNHGYSKDEEYFLVILSQISVAPSLIARVSEGGSIDRALEKSPLLDDRLTSSLVSDEDGRIHIRPETERINRIIKKIALGLFVLRYGRVPLLESITNVGSYPYSIRDDRQTNHFILTFTEKFRNKRWKHSQKSIFSYIFVRDPIAGKIWCIMDFHATLWGTALMPNPTSLRGGTERQLQLSLSE